MIKEYSHKLELFNKLIFFKFLSIYEDNDADIHDIGKTSPNAKSNYHSYQDDTTKIFDENKIFSQRKEILWIWVGDTDNELTNLECSFPSRMANMQPHSSSILEEPDSSSSEFVSKLTWKLGIPVYLSLNIKKFTDELIPHILGTLLDKVRERHTWKKLT